MGEITNYWSLSNGFSHQIIQIYVDKGESETGLTEMLPGANAEIHPDWAWEVAISGTGEPGAVYSVQSDTGATSARGIEVEGDKDTNTIVFTVSKDVIGSDVASYRYVIVSGSQDGFGTGKWRDVDQTAKTWTLGGGSDASLDDGIEYDPNVLDIVRTDDEQESILAGYDVANGVYAQLTGFEMPEISQQIYGASLLTVTDNSAIISWSTTKESDSQISCTAAGSDPISESSSEQTISHQLEVTGLTPATNYTCVMTASPDDFTQEITISTLLDADTTPPQILNIRATTDDAGLTTVSWFTDEDTFGEISLDSSSDESEFGKNHQVAYTLCVGDHEGQIIASDPSGNTATATVSFSVEGEGEKCSSSGGGGKIVTDDEASFVSSTSVQIVALVVILLVFLALIRTRRDTFE